MVGPWLFWLGPMIPGHLPAFFGMALFFCFWHCNGFPW